MPASSKSRHWRWSLAFVVMAAVLMYVMYKGRQFLGFDEGKPEG